MGRVEWELAYIITQHLKPECRGLQTQCALTALPLNAKQTYIKLHKESNLCPVLFRLGVFLAISLHGRTLLRNEKTRHQNAPSVRGRTSTGAGIGREIRSVRLSRPAVAPVCVLREGQNLSAKCCARKITGVLCLRVSLFLCFCPQLCVFGRFRRTVGLFCAVETKLVCFTASKSATDLFFSSDGCPAVPDGIFTFSSSPVPLRRVRHYD